MEASFGGVPITNESSVSTAQASGQLALIWPASPSYYYTVMMLDAHPPFLHFLQTNVPGNDLDRGNILMLYLAPHPPADSPPHTYAITIFQQPKIINADLLTSREQFNWNQFVQMYGLDAIFSLQFQVSSANAGSMASSPSGVGSNPSHNPGKDKSHWIIPGTTLDEREQKYCRCLLHVGSKQPGRCNLEKAWFEEYDSGRRCANPWAICAKSVGTTTRQCGDNYNYDAIPDSELIAFANLHNILEPEPYNRIELLRRIKEWKTQKYGG